MSEIDPRAKTLPMSSSRMETLPHVRAIGIAIRHAATTAEATETNQLAVEKAEITAEGIEQVAGLTPYFMGQFKSQPDRDKVVIIKWNANRRRTVQTAEHLITNLRKAVKDEGLKYVKIFHGVHEGHADILDTSEPLKKRINEKKDKKGQAYPNWITENEQQQEEEGIEPPTSVYKKIIGAQATTERNTIYKNPNIERKADKAPLKKQGQRFKRPTDVYLVGVTHESFIGAVIKNVDSVEQALQIGYVEPLEIHPLPRNEGIIYRLPRRNRAIPVIKSPK